MAINRIKIKNFTVFQDVSIDFNSGVNVIIGENGTGKTHLLKLLYIHSISDDFYSVFNVDREYMEQLKGAKFSFKPDKFDNLPVVFIPAKEMLSMSNITRIHDKYSKALSIDKTLIDIIKKAQNITPDIPPKLAQKIIPKLEKIIDGKIFIKPDNSFWVRKNDKSEIPFMMEAEGLRKFGLLWQLIMNESITENSVLLWDEPEANINPKLIPDLVEIMLELSRNGVQVFVTTHDYIFAKYFEVKRKENDTVSFHSLYKTDEGVKCDNNINFRDLNNNSIIIAFDELMDEVINRNMGD